MSDLGDLAIAQDDFDDIESDSDGRIAQFAQVIEGGEGEPTAFAGIDGGGGAQPGALGSGFDLDDDQAIVLPKDEVQFASMGPVIGDQEFEPGTDEVLAGGILAQAAAADVDGQVRRSPPVAPPGSDRLDHPSTPQLQLAAFQRGEIAPMDRARSVAGDGFEVAGGSITLMLGESVFGV